jgi:hypothetical protein
MKGLTLIRPLITQHKEIAMPAPYRIVNPNVGVKDVAAPAAQADYSSYLDRLMKMVPTEVIGLYLVGSGIIPSSDPVVLTLWSLLCLVGVVAMRVWGTTDAAANQATDWMHVAISAVAFIIWLLSLGGGPFATGGVFAAAHEQTPYLGSLLVLAWTFFVPIFYKGTTS